MYNVILKRVRLTIFALESSKYYAFRVCVSSRACPACTVHARYYIVICDLSRYISFSTLSRERHDFGKYLFNIKYVIWYSLLVCLKKVPILRRIERDIINIYWTSCKVTLLLSCLLQSVSSQHNFEESLHTKFHKNTSSDSLLVPRGRTDRHNEGKAVPLQARGAQRGPTS